MGGAPFGAAAADETDEKSDTSKARRSTTLLAVPPKPKKKPLKELLHISYWTTYNGPGVGAEIDQYVDGNGNPIATGSFHMLWTGYRPDSRNTFGVLSRYGQNFATTTAGGESVAPTGSIRDPRLYWRRAGIVDRPRVQVAHEARIEIPVTEAAKRVGRVTVAQSVFIANLRPSNPKWSPGVFGAASAFVNRNEPSFLNFAIGPYVTYTFNPQWSIYAWTMFDADQVFGAPFGSLNGMGRGSDSDLFRIGPMFSPVPNFQIYPCVQVIVFNPRRETTSFGLELSAQL